MSDGVLPTACFLLPLVSLVLVVPVVPVAPVVSFVLSSSALVGRQADFDDFGAGDQSSPSRAAVPTVELASSAAPLDAFGRSEGGVLGADHGTPVTPAFAAFDERAPSPSLAPAHGGFGDFAATAVPSSTQSVVENAAVSDPFDAAFPSPPLQSQPLAAGMSTGVSTDLLEDLTAFAALSVAALQPEAPASGSLPAFDVFGTAAAPFAAFPSVTAVPDAFAGYDAFADFK
jgi:hypothetical protein